MQLASLLGDVDVLERRGDPAVEVRSVVHDSRDVVPGALFCCLRGHSTDGHDLAAAAVTAGAVALLCERFLPLDVAQVRVASTRQAMAPVASAFHGHPSRHLLVAGVTGTNGKTTATWLLRSVFEAAGMPSGVLGTLTGARTTPEAPELHARLAAFREEGTRAVAMEVSSHALAQHRVDATTFAVVGFTNLSQDHLDYHGDMTQYFEAKATLFTPAFASVGVANVDDPWGRRLLDDAPIEMRAYGMPEDVVVRLDGSTFTWKGEQVALRLAGSFNVVNAVCAAAMADVVGVAPDVVAAGLSSLAAVPGRFERVDAGQPFPVVVDYAHTPDALERVLRTARQLVEGRVIVVFGCGGDRDAAKRPIMGRVATELADLAVLTDDNPRSEDPASIRAAVKAGAVDGLTLVEEPDRRAAIALAVGEAKPGDIVVIAGKGHETGQTFRDTTAPFDDRVVARELLEADA